MEDERLAKLGTQIAESLGVIFGDASPATVFSAPEVIGDSMIVTASAWERVGGFGFGGGSGSEASTGDEGGGGGGGGGGTSQGRPVAVITVSPTGVEVRPVIDFTKIGVTFLLAAVGVWRVLRRG